MQRAIPDGGFAAVETGPRISDPLAPKPAKSTLKCMNQTERYEAVQCLFFRFVHE
jgi:hypothetical protein